MLDRLEQGRLLIRLAEIFVNANGQRVLTVFVAIARCDHDDGQMPEDYDDADVVLVGISRTSKTPTSIYLANRGFKVANIPLIPESPPPESLFALRHPLVVGLTTGSDRLIQIRRNRPRGRKLLAELKCQAIRPAANPLRHGPSYHDTTTAGPDGDSIAETALVTDFELLDAWRAGDREAGNTLFERYFDAVCRFFTNKVQHNIDDLIQKTFLGCVEGRDRFQKQASFRTYLFAVAHHVLCAHFRERRRGPESAPIDFADTSSDQLTPSPSSVLAIHQEQRLLLDPPRLSARARALLLGRHGRARARPGPRPARRNRPIPPAPRQGGAVGEDDRPRRRARPAQVDHQLAREVGLLAARPAQRRVTI